MRFSGCAPSCVLLHEELRPRETEGPAQGHQNSQGTGPGQGRAPCLPSGLLAGQASDRQGGEGGLGMPVPHLDTLRSLDLFHFSASLLLFQTCLFLPRTSQLLHPATHLQDQLGSTPQQVWVDMRLRRGLWAWGTHQSPPEHHLQGQLCWKLTGGNSLYVFQFLYKQETVGGYQFLAPKNPKILDLVLLVVKKKPFRL